MIVRNISGRDKMCKRFSDKKYTYSVYLYLLDESINENELIPSRNLFYIAFSVYVNSEFVVSQLDMPR